MDILFLPSGQSFLDVDKMNHLRAEGHRVDNPALPDEDFDAAVRIAQASFDQHKPDVVIGRCRGGAVAMSIISRDTPLLLLCPAWKQWATTTTVKPNTLILHSQKDQVVPYGDSVELIANSGLRESGTLRIGALIAVGNDHFLSDPQSLRAMREAAVMLVTENNTWEYAPFIEVDDRKNVAIVRINNLARLTERARLEQLESELLDLATHGEKDSLILDFERKPFGLSHMFNSILIRLQKRLPRGLRLCNVPPQVSEHWRFAKMDKFYPTYASLEDALRSEREE